MLMLPGPTALSGVWNPPTVADTKRKFTELYKRPLPGLYSTVLQEFLVQSHLFRYTKSYEYNEVRAAPTHDAPQTCAHPQQLCWAMCLGGRQGA